MVKNIYLSRREQLVWEIIKGKEIVDHKLLLDIFPEFSQAIQSKILSSLCKKSYLARARNDLYYNPQKLSDVRKLAFMIHDGYLGLGSALRFHGLLEYEDFRIVVMTTSFRKHVELKGSQYSVSFLPLGKLFCGFVKGEVYVSSLEKTFFDCFLKIRQIGYSNITKALFNSQIDWKKFLSYFERTSNHALCQRVGYVLDLMRRETKFVVPNYVLNYFEKRVNAPVRIGPQGKTICNKRWKIQDSLGKELLSWWFA